MEIKHLLKRVASPATFILIGTVARIIPHAPNFTPIGAMALFGGTYMNKKQALIYPILAMIISDVVIGFDSIPMRLSVYASFLAIVLIGFQLKKNSGPKNIAAASLLGSLLFFIVTNFSVWAFGSMYPKTIGGLFDCHIMAIPFFRNTLFGDLFYSGVFFGGYQLSRAVIGSRSKIFNS